MESARGPVCAQQRINEARQRINEIEQQTDELLERMDDQFEAVKVLCSSLVSDFSKQTAEETALLTDWLS